ncbi:MAG: glycine/sarcosine/betaine reductase selenoprotein B family protein [Clostridium sp.]
MIKVLLILNHVQAGLASNENSDLQPTGKAEILGPGKMMKPFLDRMNGAIIATLYCGDIYYKNNKEVAEKKFLSMIKKLNPDVVVCGPAFHYENFGRMACGIATEVKTQLNINSLAVLSHESKILKDYDGKVNIFKSPKKDEFIMSKFIKEVCEKAIELGKEKNN